MGPSLALPADVFGYDYVLSAVSIYNPNIGSGAGTQYAVTADHPRAVVVYFDDTVGGPVYATQSPVGAVTLSGFSGAVKVGASAWGGEVASILSGGSFARPASGVAYASQGSSHTVDASADAGSEITPSGGVGVLPGGDVAFAFFAKPGYVIVAVEIDGVNDPSAVSAGAYMFLSVGGDHTISVKTVKTFAVIASADTGSEITPSGSLAVMQGRDAMFSFSAKPGYVIANVFVDGSNDPSAVSAGAYVFLSVGGDHTISVASVQTFSVAASADSGAEISPSGTNAVASGSDIEFMFSAKPGYAISEVLVDGVNDPSAALAGKYRFSGVDKDHGISVVTVKTFEVTATADSGSDITPSGPVTVIQGGDAMFSFSAKPGYVIVAVEVDGVNDPIAVSAGAYMFLSVGGDHTISVASVQTFVAFASADSGSEIAPSGFVVIAHGGDVAFSFSAKPGYVIADVFVDGSNDLSAASAGMYEFLNMDGDHTISVTSVPVSVSTFVVSASADSGSEITPEGSVAVMLGENMAFTFSVKPGYVIADVFVDGSSMPSAMSAGVYEFSDVDSNHTISVTTEPLSPGSPDGGADGPHAGPGDVSGGGESNPGTTVTVAAVAAAMAVGLSALLFLTVLMRRRRPKEPEPL
jgi:muramidase (phage lysozyme)